MRPSYSIVSQPFVEPITLADASEHLRVDSEDDIGYISGLIAVAREYVDSVTGRVSAVTSWLLLAPTWDSLTSNLYSREIPLLRTPLLEVSSVKYYAPSSSTLTEITAENLIVVKGAEPGWLKVITALPTVDDRPDAIQIQFLAGYRADETVPPGHRHAIKMLVAHLYEQRQPVAFASCQNIPYALDALISNQKVGGWCG